MAKNSTKERRRKRLESERYTSAEFRPYVIAIGQIALAWNDLHETLGALFVSLTAANDEMLQSAWQSLPADRAKRGMLRAALGELSFQMESSNPRAQEEMKWFLGQIDRLEEDRNNAVHAPLASYSDPIWRALAEAFGQPGKPTRFTPGVHPDDARYNKRAANLRNKNLKNQHLLAEYRYIRDAIIILRDYADDVQSVWNWTKADSDPWPERPQLPNRGQKSPDKAQRSRQSTSTQLPLPLKPSQE